MKEKKEINIILAIILVIVVVGILVFISIKNKTESTEETSSLSYGENGVTGGDAGKINMQTNDSSGANSQTGGQAVDKGGVKVTVLSQGSGKTAKDGDKVSMNYTGMFTDGTKFDSNVDPKFQHVEPFTFTLGAGQVIKGWDVGVEGMKEGEKRKLEITPEYGYGASGIPGAIPGNATLIFEVELLKVN
jgi:FKBP-type peptidyl-prolyl cis-trans isomerase FkpA